MGELLTKNSFDPHLNTDFEISAGSAGNITAKLVKIDAKEGVATEGFSLIFKGPKEPVLPQDTLKMKHAQMGEFDLFIGPVLSPEADGVYYEAVFSRLKK